MKKYSFILACLAMYTSVGFAQANISPAPPQDKTIAIVGATIHTATGSVIENGSIVFSKGKIISVSAGRNVPGNDVTIIEAQGKHVYPGFIAPVTTVGLIEIESVRATRDAVETGTLNPHVRALIAYNTDSKITPTLRSNGVLMAQITPQGGVISGQSSIVQFDAWNWEDAIIKADDAIHLNWPRTQISRSPFAPPAEQQAERAQRTLNELDQYFAAAKAYAEGAKPEVINTRFEAMKGLFNGSKKLFLNTSSQKDIVLAVNFCKKYGVQPVIVGDDDALYVASFLKDNNVPVIINQPHSLPSRQDDDVRMPYKRAALLTQAGVTVALSIGDHWQQRNLPFMAGTASTYGLSKEDALKTITINTAKILGIDKTTGSLEPGKDATLFISKGDALDMLGNDVEKAFIQGRDINLDNVQKQLYKRYSDKYGIKQ